MVRKQSEAGAFLRGLVASLTTSSMLVLAGAAIPGTPSPTPTAKLIRPIPELRDVPPIGAAVIGDEAFEDIWEPPSANGATATAAVFRAESRRAIDVLQTDALLRVSATPSADHGHASDPIGGAAHGWIGADGAKTWRWEARFRAPVHLSVLRARFGRSPTDGVPTRYDWEASPPTDGNCPAGEIDDTAFVAIDGASVDAKAAHGAATPTRRSWFVDAEACALRLRIDATNGGAPVLREVEAFAGARNVLAHALTSSDDGATPTSLATLTDGRYPTYWTGAPGRDRWTLTFKLPTPAALDRVRLELGLDATTVPRRRGTGRTYGIARGPRDWIIEGSTDGKTFTTLAQAPRREGGIPLKIRRPLVHLPAHDPVSVLRVTFVGATDDEGRPGKTSSPVVRSIEAYAASDRAPLLAAPWVLSVNANPSAMTKKQPGAEIANDIYFTKFIQQRLASIYAQAARDDRYARAMGPKGEVLPAARDESSGEAIESIEGDDPAFTSALVQFASPRPLVVLSGAGDWDFAAVAHPAPEAGHWKWDPLRPAREGGMGQIVDLVQSRSAPMIGFCGGAQILALLDAARPEEPDAALLDRMLHRADGRPLRVAPSPTGAERAWPGDGHPRAQIAFDASDPLFSDIRFGGRTVTYAMPEWHADAVRAEAFGKGGRLAKWHVAAKSFVCSPAPKGASTTKAAGRKGLSAALFHMPACTENPQAFHTTDAGFPIMGAQFHAEQRSFDTPDPKDPAWSTADPLLFVAASWEMAVDAWLLQPEPPISADLLASAKPPHLTKRGGG